MGNRKSVVEADGSRVTWTYDATYQLTGEHRTGSSAYRDTYTYDPTGNRTLKIHDGARTTSAYDAANQLTYSQDASGRTTYTFDADGNQQVVRAPNGDRTTYAWDYENRMTSVRLPSGIRNTMAYEPEGLRVKLEESTGTKKFVWDEQNYLAETDASNDTQVVYTNEPRLYGNLVSQRRLTSGVWTPHWYHFDAIGSTRELTTAGQVVSDTSLYDAWGSVIVATGASAVVFSYVGQLGYSAAFQGEASYVRARFLSASNGRWLSVDPQSFETWVNNVYGYADNSPVILIDPSGVQVFPKPNSKDCNPDELACIDRALKRIENAIVLGRDGCFPTVMCHSGTRSTCDPAHLHDCILDALGRITIRCANRGDAGCHMGEKNRAHMASECSVWRTFAALGIFPLPPPFFSAKVCNPCDFPFKWANACEMCPDGTLDGAILSLCRDTDGHKSVADFCKTNEGIDILATSIIHELAHNCVGGHPAEIPKAPPAGTRLCDACGRPDATVVGENFRDECLRRLPE